MARVRRFAPLRSRHAAALSKDGIPTAATADRPFSGRVSSRSSSAERRLDHRPVIGLAGPTCWSMRSQALVLSRRQLGSEAVTPQESAASTASCGRAAARHRKGRRTAVFGPRSDARTEPACNRFFIARTDDGASLRPGPNRGHVRIPDKQKLKGETCTSLPWNAGTRSWPPKAEPARALAPHQHLPLRTRINTATSTSDLAQHRWIQVGCQRPCAIFLRLPC